MKGFSWLEPARLWALAVVPLLAGLGLWAFLNQQKRLGQFSELALFRLLNGYLPSRGAHPGVRKILVLAALALILLAWARPGGNPHMEMEPLAQKGADIMLLVDLSSSMNAEDIQPNRIQAAKQALRGFVDSLEGDRVGLVVFAGSVSLQSPLTLDYRALKMLFEIIHTDFLPLDGTALGDAISFGLDKMGKESRKDGIIILMTDGENTRGEAPLEAARKAKAAGAKIYTIGIGSGQGAKIPETAEGKNQGRFKMYHGEPVITRLDDAVLQAIAQETGGEYFPVKDSGALSRAYQEIHRRYQKPHEEVKKRMRYDEYYVWFALPAFFLLLAALVIQFYPRRQRI